MKKTIVMSALLFFFISLGFEGYKLYKQSISKAVSSALAMQTLKHQKKVQQLKLKEKKKIAKIKTKARAKAKIQRAIAAIPLIGIAAFGAFEKMEFDEWKKENPNGTFEAYSIEMKNEVEALFKDEYKAYYDRYKQFFDFQNK